MASVFLSYDHQDEERAAPIISLLKDAGHEAWWDRHIRGGAQYSKEIEQALDQADAVVVLWSKSSVDSAWVRDEAAVGRDRGKLVPVSLDSVKPPIGFRQFQTIDLSRRGNQRDAIDQLLLAIAGGTPVAQPPRPTPKRAPGRSTIVAGTAALLAIAGVTVVAVNPFATAASKTISVAVAPADSSLQSKDLSDDLVAKLGALSVHNGELRLVESGQRSHATFTFQLGGSAELGRSRANLLLLDGSSSTILWSGQYERPTARIGDLRQEIGYSASQVLACALDAYRSRQLASRLQLLKSYLSGCAEAAQSGPAEAAALALTFRHIVEIAPKFAGGWSQLLLAESIIPAPDAKVRHQITADIRQARNLEPDMPAIYAAELSLLSHDDYARSIALVERGLSKNPDSPLLLADRSSLLFSIGRTNDAVLDAKRAVELDPTSPALRGNYIYTLANAGRAEAALDEVKEAERFWPGSSEVERVKYIVNARYGDPGMAAEYMRSSAFQGDPQKGLIYLEARIHPSPANFDRAIQNARAEYSVHPERSVQLMQALGMFGRQNELLAFVTTMPRSLAIEFREILFRPTTRVLWLDPRSLSFAKRIGLLQYWASSGKWPDFCFAPNFPYDCKKEAAKLLA